MYSTAEGLVRHITVTRWPGTHRAPACRPAEERTTPLRAQHTTGTPGQCRDPSVSAGPATAAAAAWAAVDGGGRGGPGDRHLMPYPSGQVDAVALGMLSAKGSSPFFG